MTKIGHNTSYIQILPYGAATSVGALFYEDATKTVTVSPHITFELVCINYGEFYEHT